MGNRREIDEANSLQIRAARPEAGYELLFLNQKKIQSRSFYLDLQISEGFAPQGKFYETLHPVRMSQLTLLQEELLKKPPALTD